MTITIMRRKLERAGFETQAATLYNVNGNGAETPCIVVRHDYNGPYPTSEAIRAHQTVSRMARQAGYTADERGHYTATFVY